MHALRTRAALFVSLGAAALAACGDSPSVPRGNGPELIAFAAEGAIHVVQADGSNRKGITVPAGSWDPEWSPDGSTLVFHTYQRGSEISHIWLVRADGTGLRQLTQGTFEDFSPTWSPDGREIAFVRGEAVFVMRADGTDVRQLTAWNFDEASPDWSPDGRRIAFSRGRDLWVMNADGTEQRLLHARGRDPAWSPDGGRIAFVRNVVGEPSHLHVMNADGTGIRELSIPGQHEDRVPAWSPDGQRIAFMSDQARARDTWLDLFVIDAAGTGFRALTSDQGMESYPSWRPR
jgi:Tol biopolymer transport system component